MSSRNRGAVNLGGKDNSETEGLEAHAQAERNVEARLDDAERVIDDTDRRLAELHENADIAREVEEPDAPPPGLYSDLPTAEIDNEAIAADAAEAAENDKLHAHTAFLVVIDSEGDATATPDLSLVQKLLLDRDAAPRDMWRGCAEVCKDIETSETASKNMMLMQQQAMMAQRMMQDQRLAQKLQQKGIKVDLPGAVNLG